MKKFKVTESKVSQSRTEIEDFKIFKEVFSDRFTETDRRIVELLIEMDKTSEKIRKDVFEMKKSLKGLRDSTFKGNKYVDKNKNPR